MKLFPLVASILGFAALVAAGQMALAQEEAAGAAAGAQLQPLITTGYICARGVEVPASYINTEQASYVVLHVEGRQITLQQDISGSGARYAWPSDGAHYIWWSKGDSATLYWREGGDEQVILEDCQAQG